MAAASVAVECGMILQNVTDELDQRSKVVVTKEGKLLEIRQGNNTFKKNGLLRHTWNTISDWVAWLDHHGVPHEVECLDTQQRPSIPLATPAAPQPAAQPAAQPAPQPAPQPAAEAIGTILTNDDHTSKVVVLKDGSVLEVRRGELTFTKETLKTTRPRIWKTVNEWRGSIIEEPEPKRPRSNEFVAPIEVARPLEPISFPSHELKNNWAEQLKAEINSIVDKWAQKLKME